MVQGDDEQRSFSKETFVSIRSANALSFFRISLDLPSSGASAKRTDDRLNEAESVNQYCFIQNYDFCRRALC